jgi:hypothetical protein
LSSARVREPLRSQRQRLGVGERVLRELGRNRRLPASRRKPARRAEHHPEPQVRFGERERSRQSDASRARAPDSEQFGRFPVLLGSLTASSGYVRRAVPGPRDVHGNLGPKVCRRSERAAGAWSTGGSLRRLGSSRSHCREGVVQSIQSDGLAVALLEALMTPGSLPVFSRYRLMFFVSGSLNSGLMAQWVPSAISE